MKPVTQEDGLGCGLACVASLLNENYKNTKKYFKENDLKKGLYCRDIVKVLEKAGKKYEYRYIKKKIQRRKHCIY